MKHETDDRSVEAGLAEPRQANDLSGRCQERRRRV